MPTTPVLARQLTYLLAQRRKSYRPLQFRSIVPIATGIPAWAENLEVQKISEQGNEPVPHQMGNQKAPTPSYDRSAGYLKLAEFALAYQIFDSELLRAQVTGINVSAQKVYANQRSAEEFMDRCASLGHSGYGMTGMVASADVPVVAIAGDWPNQDFDQIAQDVTNMIYSVPEQTKDLHQTNQFLLPDNAYKHLVSRTDENGNSFLSRLQEMNPGVRFVKWYRLRTAGGSSTPRAIALDSSHDVLEMPVVNELKDSEPLKIHGGVDILQTVKFGSVIIYQPLAMAYGDNLGTFT